MDWKHKKYLPHHTFLPTIYALLAPIPIVLCHRSGLAPNNNCLVLCHHSRLALNNNCLEQNYNNIHTQQYIYSYNNDGMGSEVGVSSKKYVATKNLGLPSPRQSREKPDWLFTLVFLPNRRKTQKCSTPPCMHHVEKCHRLVHPQFLLLGTASFILSTYWLRIFFNIIHTQQGGLGWVQPVCNMA